MVGVQKRIHRGSLRNVLRIFIFVLKIGVCGTIVKGSAVKIDNCAMDIVMFYENFHLKTNESENIFQFS